MIKNQYRDIRFKPRSANAIGDTLRAIRPSKKIAHPLVEISIEEQNGSGPTHKKYQISHDGVLWFITKNRLSEEKFWDLILNIIYSKNEFVTIKKNDGIVKTKKRKYLPNISNLILFYEKEILKIDRNLFYSHNSQTLLDHFRYSLEADIELFKNAFPILKILGNRGRLSFFGIMGEIAENRPIDNKTWEKEENVKNLLEILLHKGLIVRWSGARYWSKEIQIEEIGNEQSFSLLDEIGLSTLGLLLLFDLTGSNFISDEKKIAYSYRQLIRLESKKDTKEILKAFQKNIPEMYQLMSEPLTKNEQKLIKEINSFVRKNSYLLPKIFSNKNWKILSKEISKIELVFTLILQYFERFETNTREPYDQIKNLVLLNAQKQMSEIIREKLDKFYKSGLKSLQRFVENQHCKTPIEVRNPFGISRVAKLITEEITNFDELNEYYIINSETGSDFNVTKSDFDTIKKIKEPLHELIKIERKLGRRDSLETELHFANNDDFRKRPQMVSLTEIIAFQFYTRLRMVFPKQWECIMKQTQLFDWYSKWEQVIKNFYKQYMN